MAKGTTKTERAIQNGQMKREYKRYGFNLAALVFGAVLVLLLFKRCGDGGTKKPGNDTISVRVDTVYVQSKIDTHYIPKPYKVLVPTKEIIPVLSDSLILAAAIKDGTISTLSDSLAVLRDYLTTRYYDDSFKVDYGKIRIVDTVFANSIVGRGVSTKFNVPIITKTVTIEARQRTTLYIGGDMYGNANSPIYAVGGAIGLRFRNGKYYEAKALLSKDGIPLYGLGFRLPIRTKK